MPRIDDDFKVVVQLLAHVASQLSSDRPLTVGIAASDPEIDLIMGVDDTHFCGLGGRLAFVGLALAKVGDGSGLQPEWVVQSPVDSGSVSNPDRRRSPNKRRRKASRWLGLRLTPRWQSK